MFEVTCLDAYGEIVNSFTQWDIDQSLTIKDSGLSVAPTFHFCNKNSKEALVVASSIDASGIITVKVPNILLTESYPVIAYMYAYATSTSAKTLATIRIPIEKRVKPSEYNYVENIDVVSAAKIEQEVIDKLNELETKYNEVMVSLDTNYAKVLDDLKKEYSDAVNFLLGAIKDGSPKGSFASLSDLASKEAGIYVNINNGWIYYWDGTTLSDAICQYQAVQIADGSITYEMLNNALKNMAVEDNRKFATIDEAESYLTTADAAAGQLVRILESGEWQLYIIQVDHNADTGFRLASINAEISASDVPYQKKETNTYNGISDTNSAIDLLYELVEQAGFRLDFDENSHELSLLNEKGFQVGESIPLSVGGVDGLIVDTDAGEDEDGNIIYYLVVSDKDGNELSRCLLPATGGGGGGGSYLVRLLNLQGTLSYTVASSEKTNIGVLYMESLGSESTGVDGSVEVSYKLSTNDEYIPIGTYNISAAETKDDLNKALYVDVTKYLTAGYVTNVKFVVTGGESGQTKTVIFNITCVDMSIVTTTDFSQVFTSNFAFLYRCLGRGLSKTVYFYIDGELYKELDVGSSHNVQLSQTIDLINDFDYGSHDLRVYFVTAEGAVSNVIHQAIMYDDGSSTDPIIGVAVEDTEIVYGETISIDYNVYTPNQETTDSLNIKLYTIENGVESVYASAIMSNVVNQTFHTWTCDSYPTSGTCYVEFSSGSTKCTITLEIVENGSSDVIIETVDTNLVFSFNPSGKSNNDVGKENVSYPFKDVNNKETEITCSFENMNWVSDGYISTAFGTALRLASEGKMTINLPIMASSFEDKDGQNIIFSNSPVVIGRTIEISLNMHEVTNNNIDVVSCMSSEHSGFKITPQTAYFLSATGSNIETDITGFIENEESICATYVKDEKKLRIAFVLEAAQDDNKQCVCIYINGEIAKSFPYDKEENFVQNMPIVIGNPNCITDIYDIKIYDRALSENEIKTNYYASQATIAERQALYKDNDVLDDNEEISYEKAIYKYPCLLCIGTLSPYKGAKNKVGWILTKPDGNGGYTVEFSCTEQIDDKYIGTINVQGTTSQKFMRKNYKVYPVKIKRGEDGEPVIDEEKGTIVTEKVKYAIKKGGIAESTLCWKADYMSTDHANTFNANLADQIMSTIAPNEVQIANPKVQACVNGFRCLLFNQIDDNSPKTFAGDGCLNNDKGNNKAFGLENSGDDGNVTKVQKYEFLNNTSDICHFKVDNFQHMTEGKEQPDVYDAFESTYPDQGDLEDAGLEPDWSHLQVVCTWLAQRANFWDADGTTYVSKVYKGVTYHTEREYRKAIFINEFTKHFNKNRALIYYLFLQFTALVDNRAKNMFFTCFDVTKEKLLGLDGQEIDINDCIDEDGNVNADLIDWENSIFCIWETTLYDLDSCYSAENNGYLRVPYYADWDYELKGKKQFNGYDSRLWLPFEEAFPTDIFNMANTLATAELMCYDKFYAVHISENANMMCPTVVNKDMIYKYEAPWNEGYYDYSESTTNPTFVYTGMYKYLHRGQRGNQKETYIYNRSHLWYSQYQTIQYRNNNINFRVGASNGVSAANADLTLTAAIALYIGARYGDTSTSAINNGKIMPNTPTTLHATNGVGRSDTVYLYSGTDLTDIGDISVFEPYEIQLRNAKKLKNLIIGSLRNTNTSLSALDTTACTLLQRLNIQNCASLVGTLDLSSNGLIEEVYAQGSGVTYVRLPSGGNLKELHLPAVRTLSILNHTKLEHFSCESYANMNQVRIENTPHVPANEILMNYAEQLTSGIRLVGVDWNLSNSDIFDLLLSDKVKGKYITSSGTLSEDVTAYPYISGDVYITRINQNTYNMMKEAYPYLNIHYQILTHTVTFYDGDGKVFNVQEIDDGYPANTPLGTPTKKPTAQYVYSFINYDTSYTRVVRDLSVGSNFSRTLQKYDVYFYQTAASATYLQKFTGIVFGNNVEYTGKNPSTEGQLCMGWFDRSGEVYESNTIQLTTSCCVLGSNDKPQDVVFYCNYQTIAMPTQSVASLSLMNYAQIKAVANRIKAGSGDGWIVAKNEADNQYILSNTQSGVTVTVSMGDEIEIPLTNGTTEVFQIYDFLHDEDENGHKIGITFGMRDLYSGNTTSNFTRTMNPSYKQCYKYTLAGQDYENNNADYSASDDTVSSTVHKVTTAEANSGFVTMVVKGRTFLRSIVVTDAGGTPTTWHYDYRGYYSGDDVQKMTTPSWYISDFAQNTYKLGKALFNATGGSYSDGTILKGKNVAPANFGGMELDTTKGQIQYYVDTSGYNNYAVYSEIMPDANGTVTIKIPVSNGDTVTINHWSFSRNVGGYKRTAMREWMLGTFYNLLPMGWKNIIVNAVKTTGVGNRRTDADTTIDPVWLFSGIEVGTVSDTNTYKEGTLYPIFPDATARIKKGQKGKGSAGGWWLRSPIVYITYGTYYFLYVNTNGGNHNYSAHNTIGVVAGFCV